MTRTRKRPSSPAAERATPDRLLDAAAAEFQAHGYFATDTNRIARRAGFAPQTFYRHFPDKLAAFIAVYARWSAAESEAVRRAASAAENRAAAAAGALLAFHRDWAVFRRSLRLLAVDDDRVRQARADSRSRQIAALAGLPRNAGRSRADLLAALLAVERLCDAAADGEPADLAVPEAAWRRAVTAAVAAARGEAG
ncbi:MAG: helix-turn-helix domain-containing protein [Hyphomonadaceae bacterium]|nr:helix-turn-helix domain-containing protein [Hyphomonadaceae bacterium]